MRQVIAILLAVSVIAGLGVTVADARAGRPNADCPVGSKDPDCQ